MTKRHPQWRMGRTGACDLPSATRGSVWVLS
jgi:hypothetical protein